MTEAAPIRCPYCGSIENNGRACFWCGNSVTEFVTTAAVSAVGFHISPVGRTYNYYESEEKNMTIELKFSGLTPEQALKLIKEASGTSAEAEVNAETPTQMSPSAPAAIPPVSPAISPTAATTPPTAPTTPPTAPTIPVAQSAPAPIPTAPPTAVKQYTADELAVAARPVCELPGGREKLLELLHSFTYTDSTGAVRTVQSIMEMPPELYPALANGIRQLGGRI